MIRSRRVPNVVIYKGARYEKVGAKKPSVEQVKKELIKNLITNVTFEFGDKHLSQLLIDVLELPTEDTKYRDPRKLKYPIKNFEELAAQLIDPYLKKHSKMTEEEYEEYSE